MHAAAQKLKLDRPPFWFFLSFFLVGAAQPDWSTLACILTSAFGYALFWFGLVKIEKKKSRFLSALLWFFSIQAIHLSWFMSDEYVGKYIYIGLVFLYLALGLQFALVSLWIQKPKEISLLTILGISGLWTILEWSRLFALSGFSLNPVGLALTGTITGMQMASAFGVFGLTFMIFFTNLLALKVMAAFSWRGLVCWALMALIPYLYGSSQLVFHEKLLSKSDSKLNVLLVQTALNPEEKMSYNRAHGFSPLDQWVRILHLISPHVGKPIDLIVLSEAVLPFGAEIPIYYVSVIEQVFQHFFGTIEFVPLRSREKVGNSFWAQTLANALRSDVVIGLEDVETVGESPPQTRAYNAAFHFHPYSQEKGRYEKRVLVPMGEYIPFSWCRKILRHYGIEDSFTPGSEAKIFKTERANLGLSICYEETYGNLMRESRLKGADVLVNLTNDGWYPKSRLPAVHFFHGRLRAVEGGIPLVRSCNTGVTCGVDALGRIVGRLQDENHSRSAEAAALYLSLPLYAYPTFYAYLGDWPMIIFSLFSVCLAVSFFYYRKIFAVNELGVSHLRKN